MNPGIHPRRIYDFDVDPHTFFGSLAEIDDAAIICSAWRNILPPGRSVVDEVMRIGVGQASFSSAKGVTR
jgi:hypothetical protein